MKPRLPKSASSQAAADELKRKQLDAILHEQHKKIMDRQEKLQREQGGGTGSGVAGQLQRYVMHNQREVKRTRQEVVGIKLIRSAAGERMCLPKGISMPSCLL